MSFSTAPGFPTHWAQTSISLENDYSLDKGGILRGVFQMQNTPGGELDFQIGVIAEDGKMESNKYHL